MRVIIFRDGALSAKTINNVSHVICHSPASGNGGLDIEVKVFNEDWADWAFEEKKIHLDKWDFYSIVDD